MPDDTFKILQLRVSNTMAIRAVELDLDGAPVVTITGENAQGKSALLLAIAMALGGKRAMVEEALRKGEKKGEIFLDLGRYQIRRTITKSGTYLDVSEDGVSLKSPQKVLDLLTGPFFEPLAPIRMSPKEQAELLRRISGVDVSDLDTERAAVYEQRADANREAKRLRAHAGSLPTYGDAPDEPVDTEELGAELDRINGVNRRNNDLRYEAKQAGATLESAQEEHAALKLKLAEAERAMKDAYQVDADAKAQLINLEDADEAPVIQQIREAGETNRKVAANAAAGDAIDGAEDAANQALLLTQRLAAINEQKADRLAKSKLGVPGLSFSDDRGYFRDLPLEQASQAQQIKIWASLFFADNPAIRVLFVRDASLLDRKSRATIAQIAEHHKAQFLLEMVESDDPAAIRIENGLVVE